MYILLLILSLIILFVGGLSWQKNSHLLQFGKKADGIIFKNNLVDGMYYHVVRFLTDKQEWVTQELAVGENVALKEGTKIKVIYDPDNPNHVEIGSSLNLHVLPVIFIFVGLIMLSISLLQLFEN